jgi:leader peptidase (prepilin peptidase)/N-methyltransferase
MAAEYVSLIPIALIAALAIPLAVTDIKEHRLPNKYTYFLITASVAGAFFGSLLQERWGDFAVGLVLGLITAVIGYPLARFGAMGMGDIKLLIAMNVCLGWHSPILVLFSLSLGLASASVIGLLGLLTGKLSPRTLIPLGPYLLLGFLTVSYLPAYEIVTGEALS